jgi:hypothetical protein
LAGLVIRVARAVNLVLHRRGSLWSDRYHSRALRTPREVRLGIIYVVLNFRKHVPGAKGVDPCSSAFWLDGWKVPPSSGPPEPLASEHPIRAAQTWLAQKGWQRAGLIGSDEGPKLSASGGR